MKKQILLLAALVALALPSFSQKALETAAVEKFPKYVQLSQAIITQGLKVNTISSVGSTLENTVNIVGDDGKGYTFTSDADAINYMDKMGFDFVEFIPLPAPVPGATFIRQILFRKK